MGANLISQLQLVEDFRILDGRRHSLWLMLLFIIMGTTSGYIGYRAWRDFVKRHRRVLIQTFEIQKHGVTKAYLGSTSGRTILSLPH